MSSPFEPNTSGSKTLTDALEFCFRQFGDSAAIDAPGFKMTYAQLDGMSRQLASEIRGRCSDQQLKSKPIAIVMSRSVEFYVAQIAVLRAGGFFLPIDPLQPAKRIEFLLSDSSSLLLLVRENDSFAVENPTVIPISINVDRWAEECGCRERKPPADETDTLGTVTENDFAYMIYTSGSTGQPKGVPIAHRSIYNLCHWWSTTFGRSHGQRTLQMMSVGFDASLEEIFSTLTTGGTLIPIQPEALDSMTQFVDFVARQNVENVHLPTALWHLLSASFTTHESLKLPASVRTVVFGGEKTDPKLVESWFAEVSTDVRLINAYGPTEATVAASYVILHPGGQPSIGKPIRGVNFCVCDKDGQLVESGQPGELYIGGVGVAAEYWNRKELSAEKFVDSPLRDNLTYYRTGDLVRLKADGDYEFVGRIDDQVKLRGYRIEPGEISACLGSHPEVSQAHVLARHLSSDSDAQHLIGYVVFKSDEDNLDESELREFLGQQLPAYMVPTKIVVMESFPITAGGKLDLKQFPSPSVDDVFSNDGGKANLQTATEQRIAKVWKQVLGISRLDRVSNFFQLGGDSLSAMRLVLLLESEFPGPAIPVAALIPNPTIAEMANYIDRRQHNAPRAATENWPLLTRLDDCQQPIGIVCIHAAGGGGMFYRKLFDGFEPSVPVAVLESALLHQETPVALEQQNIADMAQDYVDCLIDAGCDQKLILVGYSFGSLMALEMARLLKLKGYVVKKIINIDCPNPRTMEPQNRLSRLWCRIRTPVTLSNRIADYRYILRRKRQMNELEKLTEANLPPTVDLRPLALEREFGALAEKYVPEQSDISMYLIKGEYPEAMYRIPDDYGWTEMVSALTVAQIPGGHNTIFFQPYLQWLVIAFREALVDEASLQSAVTNAV